MQRLFSLFKTNDVFYLGVILLLGIASARMPDVFESAYPYPSVLYSIFTTIAQTMAPLFAALLFAGLYLRGKGKDRELPDIVKSAFLICAVMVLSIGLMPFAEVLYAQNGLRQGVVVILILLSFWSFGNTLMSFSAMLLSRPDPSSGDDVE